MPVFATVVKRNDIGRNIGMFCFAEAQGVISVFCAVEKGGSMKEILKE